MQRISLFNIFIYKLNITRLLLLFVKQIYTGKIKYALKLSW